MFLRIHQYYLGLKPLKQLLFLFILNAMFWYGAWAFYNWYFNEEQKSFWYRLFHAAWMSLIITIPLNWKKLNQAFKKSPHEKF